jgi:hypothetical protein
MTSTPRGPRQRRHQRADHLQTHLPAPNRRSCEESSLRANTTPLNSAVDSVRISLLTGLRAIRSEAPLLIELEVT